MKNENLKTELKKDQAYSNLLRIASQARSMRQAESEKDILAASLPLNHFIKKIYGLENEELSTFNDWKKRGFVVKKGEKAFIFFSSPKSIKIKGKDIAGEEVDTAFNRFCKCYLFTKNQVEPLKA
jgi:hypothetical protein